MRCCAIALGCGAFGQTVISTCGHQYFIVVEVLGQTLIQRERECENVLPARTNVCRKLITGPSVLEQECTRLHTLYSSTFHSCGLGHLLNSAVCRAKYEVLPSSDAKPIATQRTSDGKNRGAEVGPGHANATVHMHDKGKKHTSCTAD